MARPKLEIDAEEVYKLAQIGCKVKEIAAWFGCSDDTISMRFSAELEKGRSNLKMSLRRWQLEAAKKGNAPLLIWLGKQMLEQRDVHEIHLEDTNQVSPEVSDEELIKIATQGLK